MTNREDRHLAMQDTADQNLSKRQVPTESSSESLVRYEPSYDLLSVGNGKSTAANRLELSIAQLMDQGISQAERLRLTELVKVVEVNSGGAIDARLLSPKVALKLAEFFQSYTTVGRTSEIGAQILDLANAIPERYFLTIPNGSSIQKLITDLTNSHSKSDALKGEDPIRYNSTIQRLAEGLTPFYRERWSRFPALAKVGNIAIQEGSSPPEEHDKAKILLAGGVVIENLAKEEELLSTAIRKATRIFIDNADEIRALLGNSSILERRLERDLKKLEGLCDSPWTLSPKQREFALSLCGYWRALVSQADSNVLLESDDQKGQQIDPVLLGLLSNVKVLAARCNFCPDASLVEGTFASDLSQVKEDPDSYDAELSDIRQEMLNLSRSHSGYVRLEYLSISQAEKLNAILCSDEFSSVVGSAKLCSNIINLYSNLHPEGRHVRGVTQHARLLIDKLMNYRREDSNKDQIEQSLLRMEDAFIKSAEVCIREFTPLLQQFLDPIVANKLDPLKQLACELFILTEVLPKYNSQLEGHALDILDALESRRDELLNSNIGKKWANLEGRDTWLGFYAKKINAPCQNVSIVVHTERLEASQRYCENMIRAIESVSQI